MTVNKGHEGLANWWKKCKKFEAFYDAFISKFWVAAGFQKFIMFLAKTTLSVENKMKLKRPDPI